MAELKIGLVGTGAIGRTHIERINNSLQGGRVVACADANIDFCKSVAEKYSIKAFATGEEMINSDEVEAVICTTADPFHEQYVMAAIKAGKPVFCEKPLAPPLRRASVSWKPRWRPASIWCRSASCAALIPAISS